MGPEHVTSSIGLIYLEIPELNWLAPPFNGETITSSQPGMLISSLLKVFWEGHYRTVWYPLRDLDNHYYQPFSS